MFHTDVPTADAAAGAISAPGLLPLVVQLGFAGSRRLFEGAAEEDAPAKAAREEAVVQLLMGRIQKLRADLHLEDRHFFCGVSQVAIGADMLFAKACAALGIPHRILLPQPLEDFLAAGSVERKQDDFTPEQRQEARALVAGRNVIECRAVSDATERKERFADTNVEIVRICQVVICLLREGATGEKGGSNEFLEMARQRGVPAVKITVSSTGEAPTFQETLESWSEFKIPRLPHEIDTPTKPAGRTRAHAAPEAGAFYDAVRAIGRDQAKALRRLVAWSARIILSVHIVATLLACFVLANHDEPAVPWLLGAEVLLLGTGWWVHWYLHGHHAVQRWALSRVITEIARALVPSQGLHYYAGFLFHLSYPDELRPLLRTFNVVHLGSGTPAPPADWEQVRDQYRRVRLRRDDPGQQGQLVYHRQTAATAKRQLRAASFAFMLCSGLAILASAAKFLVACHLLPLEAETAHGLGSWLGIAAICLPVVAVAVLSLAAVLDLEARARVSEEMVKFLERYDGYLARAGSYREFSRLLVEIEYRLLGENVSWYNRRAFSAVA